MGCSIVSMDHSPMPYEAPVRTNCHICVIHREFMFVLCFTHVFVVFFLVGAIFAVIFLVSTLLRGRVLSPFFRFCVFFLSL